MSIRTKVGAVAAALALVVGVVSTANAQPDDDTVTVVQDPPAMTTVIPVTPRTVTETGTAPPVTLPPVTNTVTSTAPPVTSTVTRTSTVPPVTSTVTSTVTASPIPTPTTTSPTTTAPPPPPAGARPYFTDADWLWDKIPSNPVLHTNSTTWAGYLSEAGKNQGTNTVAFGVTMIPPSAIKSDTPRYDITFTNNWGPDPFGTIKVPIPRGTKSPTLSDGDDGHLAVIDPVSGKAFGLWQARYNASNDTWSASWGGITDLTGDGHDKDGTGSTATEIARYAGVVTAAELSEAMKNNTGINHTLFFASDTAGPGYVYPAGNSDGENAAKVAIPIPEGYRVFLSPTINVDAIAGITPGEKVIAKTMQTYGAILGDRGGSRMGFIFERVPGASASNPGAVYTSAGFAWDYWDMNHIPWQQLRVMKNWNGS